jgi:hypothetical protein
MIEGGWVSFTVTVKEHEAELLAASLTLQLTVVTPFANVEPESGEQSGVRAPSQLSVAGAVKLTAALQALLAVGTEMFAGHVMTGA